MVESPRARSGRSDHAPPPRGVFDVRADCLTPGVLYMASGTDSTGKVNTALINVIEKRLSYKNPNVIETTIAETDIPKHEQWAKSIFWNTSSDLQLDDNAYIDASWAAESIEVSKQVKELAMVDPVYDNEFDRGVARVNNIRNVTSKLRVLDLAAGIGGNLVYFGIESDLAIGVEIDQTRVEICKNNVNVYGLTNTHVLEDDLFHFIEEFAQEPLKKATELGVEQYFLESPVFDCVHISPPWGGKSYPGASGDAVYTLQCNFDIERAMKSMSKIADIVTVFLPRSQSVNELVKLASIGGFPLVIIAAYHLPKKVRCIHAHFVKRVECFKSINLEQMERTHVPYKQTPHALNILIHSTPYNTLHVNMKSQLHMDHVIHAIMKILDEKLPIIAIKLYHLLRLYSLPNVIALVNQTREIHQAGGMTKTNSDEKRTIGGIFFHLLKTQNKIVYKQVEKLSD
ncbi:Trimethylguanosine synthase [Babesia sp. Xinjiang]|uniref:Trimethylguanosine synthase n=1 Tax=Babesia sp. Xinjiang TaxID=462227 RepID=UPI000A2569E7|nr:Trimethylguanosine synthase [Babesia sp. Xinjiang]ORM39396.1 Trimethylguanosine synthase [Babesia sp. Xinjiang]